METIETIKSKTKKSKKELKEKASKLAEHLDETDCIELSDDDDNIVCILDVASTRVKSRIRK